MARAAAEAPPAMKSPRQESKAAPRAGGDREGEGEESASRRWKRSDF
jgi:hypothetical protein